MDQPVYLRVLDSGISRRRLLLAALVCGLACTLPCGAAKGMVCNLPASPGRTAGQPAINGPDHKVDDSGDGQNTWAETRTSPTIYNRLPEAAPWWSAPIACVVVSAVELARWRRRRKPGRG
jgi:hypothetical protein